MTEAYSAFSGCPLDPAVEGALLPDGTVVHVDEYEFALLERVESYGVHVVVNDHDLLWVYDAAEYSKWEIIEHLTHYRSRKSGPEPYYRTAVESWRTDPHILLQQQEERRGAPERLLPGFCLVEIINHSDPKLPRRWEI